MAKSSEKKPIYLTVDGQRLFRIYGNAKKLRSFFNLHQSKNDCLDTLDDLNSRCSDESGSISSDENVDNYAPVQSRHSDESGSSSSDDSSDNDTLEEEFPSFSSAFSYEDKLGKSFRKLQDGLALYNREISTDGVAEITDNNNLVESESSSPFETSPLSPTSDTDIFNEVQKSLEINESFYNNRFAASYEEGIGARFKLLRETLTTQWASSEDTSKCEIGAYDNLADPDSPSPFDPPSPTSSADIFGEVFNTEREEENASSPCKSCIHSYGQGIDNITRYTDISLS